MEFVHLWLLSYLGRWWWDGGAESLPAPSPLPSIGQCSRITRSGLTRAVSATAASVWRRVSANGIWDDDDDDDVHVLCASSLWMECGAEMIFQSGLWREEEEDEEQNNIYSD